METLFKDLRYGIRSLLKQPAFTLIAIITLALAIGANSAMLAAGPESGASRSISGLALRMSGVWQWSEESIRLRQKRTYGDIN